MAAIIDEQDKAFPERLVRIVQRSPMLVAILEQWPAIDLPDARLSSGALAQIAWNDAFAMPPSYGSAEIDLVYFDGADLSEEMEACQAAALPWRLEKIASGPHGRSRSARRAAATCPASVRADPGKPPVDWQ